MVVRKNEPKPSLIVIMTTRTGCLYNKQANSKTQKSHPLSKNCCSSPFHHYTIKEK